LAGLTRGEDIYGTSASISVYDPQVYGSEDKSGGLATIISGYSFDKEHPNAIGVGWFVSIFAIFLCLLNKYLCMLNPNTFSFFCLHIYRI
jgi:hypothetical protein